MKILIIDDDKNIVEADEPQYFQTERGFGYRLMQLNTPAPLPV